MKKNFCYSGAITAMLLALGGCASPGNVAKEAVDANLAFERQNNDLLLLNVMRASKDLPMHFSRINTLRLSAGTAGLSAKGVYPPLAALPVIGSGGQLGSAVQRGGLELGLAGPPLPALDVTPLDGQEFMQGIMQPVALSTLPVLSELGWPTELIVFLLLDSVSVPDAANDKLIHLYQNDPRHPTYGNFVKYVQDLSLQDCVLVAKPDEKQKQWTQNFLGAGETRPTLEGVAAAKTAGLLPYGLKNGELYFGTTPNHISLNCIAQPTAPEPSGEVAKQVGTWRSANRPVEPGKTPLQALRESFSVGSRTEGRGAIPTGSEAALRSPYGVLTYLGTLQRAGRTERFAVAPGSGDGPVVARAELLGESFHVPANMAGTLTVKSLSIAWQLLQLQSKGATAPVTGTVRLAQ